MEARPHGRGTQSWLLPAKRSTESRWVGLFEVLGEHIRTSPTKVRRGQIQPRRLRSSRYENGFPKKSSARLRELPSSISKGVVVEGLIDVFAPIRKLFLGDAVLSSDVQRGLRTHWIEFRTWLETF
jgi:hypothetical protein